MKKKFFACLLAVMITITMVSGLSLAAGQSSTISRTDNGIPIGSSVFTYTTMVSVVLVADDTTTAFQEISLGNGINAGVTGGNVIGFCFFPDPTATPTTEMDIYLYADSLTDSGLPNSAGSKIDLLGGTGVDLDTTATYTCKQVQLGGKDVPFPFVGSQTLSASGNSVASAAFKIMIMYQ